MEWCNLCKRSFASEQALLHHIRDAPAHTPSYDCDACDRSFASEQALLQHIRDARHIPSLTTTMSATGRLQANRRWITTFGILWHMLHHEIPPWTYAFGPSQRLHMIQPCHQLNRILDYATSTAGDAAMLTPKRLGTGIKVHSGKN
jgi:Zinc-finger double-stranded RNA-binding/Zinc-finger of C2H2 type